MYIYIYILYMCRHIAIVLPCVANPVLGALLGGEPSPRLRPGASGATAPAELHVAAEGVATGAAHLETASSFSGKATWVCLKMLG